MELRLIDSAAGMLGGTVQQVNVRGVVVRVRGDGLAEDVHDQATFAARYLLGRMRPIVEAGPPATA